MACTFTTKAVCPPRLVRDCASAPTKATFLRGVNAVRPNPAVALNTCRRRRAGAITHALLDPRNPGPANSTKGQGIAGAKFDDEAFKIVGIPGVEITRETMGADGTVLEGMGKEGGVLEGTVMDDGKVAALTESENEDLSLELDWDPEKFFPDAVDDDKFNSGSIIERRLKEREIAAKKAKEEEEAEERAKLRAELEEFRASRTIPSEPPLLLQYLLDSEINELEFEMTRVRPSLTPQFFDFVRAELENSFPDSSRREQVEGMLQATQDFVNFMDANVKALAAPADRLKKLLTSKNPRNTIAEMAGEGEIDQQLMALLFTNIDMAQKAGDDRAAMFMEKVHAHCMKFYEAPKQQPKVVLNASKQE